MAFNNDAMHEAGSSMRQKRVMPSRSRRGGPGIGSNDTDQMILDTQRRKSENEPLIPSTTKFLLTTNSSYIPSVSSSSTPFELNSHAYERYFDRPEVLESYKAQSTIQTPEFTSLADSASVGGRFRPRLNNNEVVRGVSIRQNSNNDGSFESQDVADTSDAVYEKRHRKYEFAEKRQRLREKEKLTHQQYKLKERIEQLRVMDITAFLALPASQFSSPAPLTAESATVASDDPDADDAPALHPNGAAAYHEGERRRGEMLDVAMELEERFRILLPPDRRYLERERLKISDGASSRGDAEEPPAQDALNNLDADAAALEPSNKLGERLKVKLKLPPRNPTTPVVSSGDVPMRRKRRVSLPSAAKGTHTSRSHSQGLVHPIEFPVNETDATEPVPPTPISETILIKPKLPKKQPRPYKRRKAVAEELDSEDVDMAPPHVDGMPSPPRDTSTNPSLTHKTYDPMSIPIPRHKSVVRAQSMSLSHRSSPKPTNLERSTCVLLVSAMRSSTAPLGRKAQRHTTAFGTKTPDTLEDVREFELPRWLSHPEETAAEEDAIFRAGYRGPSPSETPGPYDPALELANGTLGEQDPADFEDTKTKSEDLDDAEDDCKDDPDFDGGDVEMEQAAAVASSRASEALAASALLQL